MKTLVDAEWFLYVAATSCEFEAQWGPDDWTYLCRHGDAQALFQDSIGQIRDTIPDGELVLAFGDRVTFRRLDGDIETYTEDVVAAMERLGPGVVAVALEHQHRAFAKLVVKHLHARAQAMCGCGLLRRHRWI
jgi:hypothetical protein